MKNYRLPRVFFWVLLAPFVVLPAQAAETPLMQHMQRILTDGDQWRTPNPGYDPEQGGPESFGLTFELAPDGSHATGQLTGIHADGRQAVYWTLLALYNPVTEKVVIQQIGWNGAYLRGEVPLQPGPVQIVDMIQFGVDGKLSYSRHENHFEAPDRHVSLVLEPDGQGAWHQKQRWEWARYPHPGERQSSRAGTALVTGLAEAVGHLLEGSGRWRAPNPAYEPGGTEEQYYGMNFRVGPHGQHVIGEIVSVFADGRVEQDWTMYITHNPVTGKTWMEQTGRSGVYFRGQLEKPGKGRRVHGGIVYLPNGQANSVRDEIEIINDGQYKSHVFERAADGSWEKAREWTWTRLPQSSDSG